MTISAEEIAEWVNHPTTNACIHLTKGESEKIIASITDMKTEIERLKEELDSAVDGNSRLALILNEKRAEAKDSAARIAALEAQLAEAVANEREECAAQIDAHAKTQRELAEIGGRDRRMYEWSAEQLYLAAADIRVRSIRFRPEQEGK